MSAVLIDTSVWRAYFTGRMGVTAAQALAELLDGNDDLLIHPAVVGELILGGLSARHEDLLSALPKAPEVSSLEVLAFIKQRKLLRRGIGWVDAQLLASALVSPALLWSLDKALAKASRELATEFDTKVLRH